MNMWQKIQHKLKYRSTKEMRTKGGLIVIAATDDFGSHVIVRGDEEDGTHLVSQDMGNYRSAKKMAKKVAQHGTGIYDDWRSPLGFFEVVCLAANTYVRS